VTPPNIALTPRLAGSAASDEDELIILAMEAGGHPSRNRGRAGIRWRAEGDVACFVDAAGHSPRMIYTRDVHPAAWAS